MHRPNLEKRDALGKFIASRRFELRLSLREVARRIGMTSGGLSQIETDGHGHRNPFSLLRIFHVLGCEIPQEFQTEELRELMEFLQKMKPPKNPLEVLGDFMTQSGLQGGQVRQALEMLRFVMEQQKAGYSLQSLFMQRDGVTIQLQFTLNS